MIRRTLRFLAILICVILMGVSVRSIRAQEPPVTVDWQTYTDIDYGFSFTFPIDWQAVTLYSDPYSPPDVNQKRIALRDGIASLVYVSVWSLAEEQNMQEWLSLHRDHFYSSQVAIPAEPNAVVAGTPAWFVISPTGEQLPGIAAVLMEHGGIIYAIEYIAREYGSSQVIVAQVLESFKFPGQSTPGDILPPLPWFDAPLGTLALDCCGFHDGQPNPYLCSGGNCVWWTAYKRDDITTESLGNAMNWITNAPNYGFPTGKVPVVGAVVVYQPGVQWAGSVGHTAYVESVSSSNPNNFTITEMSWGGDCSVNTRNSWVQDGVDFIYNKNSLIRPSYVEASDGMYQEKTSVLWNPSPGATHYQVWRGLNNSSATAGMLEGNIGTNSFNDTTITPGVLYYYWIKACNASFCTSFSAYNSGYAIITLPPNPPPAPIASDNLYQDKVAVSWTTVVYATRYEVWRGVEIAPASLALLNSNTNSPFHDNSALQGTLYYYRVKACNVQGCSGFSPFDSGITSGINAPANVSASDGQYIDRVQVSFQGVAGVQGYEVFRNTSNNLTGAVLLGSAATSIYQDTTAIPGVLYYYWVRGFNANQYGPSSDSDSGTRSTTIPPATFAKASPVLGAPNQLSDLNFSWGPSAGAVSYEFCLDTLNDAHCNGTWTNTGLNTTISLSDLAPILTYFWQVRAINSNGMTYANGASAAWWSFSTHADCFLLTATHTVSGANPTVSPDRSPVCASTGSFVAGENINLTNASADPAWRISGWTGTSNDNTTAASNSITMPAAHASVLVNYALNCFTLTISKSGPGTLPVPNPASSVGCPGGKYAPGEVISLSGADADTGYYISGWTGTNNNTSTSAGNSVTMPGSNHIAGVIYSPECYSLNFDIQPTGAGTIDWDYPDRCDSGAFPYGTIVSITAIPSSANYRFLNWSGHLSGSVNPTQITMNGDKVVNVLFEQSTFIDVPFSHPMHSYIETLWDSGYTKGCNPNPLAYCPERAVTRAEMAVFLERGLHGPMTTPPDLVPTFIDTPGHWAEDWIEALFNDGLTKGCGEGKYCPESPTTRAEMAVFLLRAKYGATFIPPTATGIFNDVPLSHWAVDWIEKLYSEAITTGCNVSPLVYCPEQAVTRAQMAAFLVRTFELP